MTGAPVYYKGLVFVGMSGGEFGARGSMTAYNASDGRLAWRFYTCPMPGDIGGATWSGDEWMTCGATVWSYPAIDTDDRHHVLHDVECRPVDGPRPGPEPLLVLDGRARHEDGHVPVALPDGSPRHLGLRLPVAADDVRHGGRWRRSPRRRRGLQDRLGVHARPRHRAAAPEHPREEVPAEQAAEHLADTADPVGDAFATQCADKKLFSGKAPDGKPYKIGCIFTPFDTTQFVALAPGALGGTNWPPMSFNPQTNLHLRLLRATCRPPSRPFRSAQTSHVGGQGLMGVQFALGKAKGIAAFTGQLHGDQHVDEQDRVAQGLDRRCAPTGRSRPPAASSSPGEPSGLYHAYNALTGEDALVSEARGRRQRSGRDVLRQRQAVRDDLCRRWDVLRHEPRRRGLRVRPGLGRS